MGPTLLQSQEEKDKQKIFLIQPKMYVLQWTLYVCKNVHHGFLKIFYLRCFVLFCKIFWTLPCSKVSTPLPPPKKSIGQNPMDLKTYTLAKKPATVTRQLTKSIDFRQNYVSQLWLPPQVTEGGGGGMEEVVRSVIVVVVAATLFVAATLIIALLVWRYKTTLFICKIQPATPRLGESGSRRLPDSPSLRVADCSLLQIHY